MLMQSHEGMIDLLPALPDEWKSGRFRGVSARGGFDLDLEWKEGGMNRVEVLSKAGQPCRIRTGIKGARILCDGKRIRFKELPDGTIEFNTEKNKRYVIG
jgi:alpha-L-fucosidase 2